MTASADMTIPSALTAWNETAQSCGWPLVRMTFADGKERPQPRLRVSRIREILANGGMEDWREALAKAKASAFLCGRTSRSQAHAGWRFNIDTMIQPGFFAKLGDGNYDNAAPAGPAYKSPMDSLWEARLSRYCVGGLWLDLWGARPENAACEAPRAIVEAWRARQALN